MKKLIFYLWVSKDFETNEAVQIHKILLKKYLNIFDELNFVAAIDDTPNYTDIRRCINWLNDICGERKYNLRVVDNIKIRESRVILEDIIPAIEQSSDDFIFMAHSKGITDVNMGFRNKESILRWVISMYWYNLEYVDEAIGYLKSGKGMYGSLLTKSTPNGEGRKLHRLRYIGSFYWINPNELKKSVGEIEYVPKGTDRFLAENLPLYFPKDVLSSHNMIEVNSKSADLYYAKEETWKKYLVQFGDEEEALKFQNNILKMLKEDVSKL